MSHPEGEVSLPWADWNGTRMPLADVMVSVLDRSFLFGDGVYEVLRVYQGQPFLIDQHFQRLRNSLQSVRIATDVDLLRRRTEDLLTESGVLEGVIYLQVSRGEAPRTHYFPKTPTRPNELIYVQRLDHDPYAEFRASGARAITTPDLRWKRCDIKSVNLLANCLAAQQAVEAGCQEAIFVNSRGTITEGAHTSVFGVLDGHLLTSPLGEHILPGITRTLVLDLARDCDIPVLEEAMRVDHLEYLHEVFITGTTSEVLPIVEIDGRPVGEGCPGPVATRLQEAYRRRIAQRNI